MYGYIGLRCFLGSFVALSSRIESSSGQMDTFRGFAEFHFYGEFSRRRERPHTRLYRTNARVYYIVERFVWGLELGRDRFHDYRRRFGLVGVILSFLKWPRMYMEMCVGGFEEAQKSIEF